MGTIGLNESNGLDWKQLFNSNGQLQKVVFALFGVVLALIIFYLLRMILEWLGDKWDNAANASNGTASSRTTVNPH